MNSLSASTLNYWSHFLFYEENISNLKKKTIIFSPPNLPKTIYIHIVGHLYKFSAQITQVSIYECTLDLTYCHQLRNLVSAVHGINFISPQKCWHLKRRKAIHLIPCHSIDTFLILFFPLEKNSGVAATLHPDCFAFQSPFHHSSTAFILLSPLKANAFLLYEIMFNFHTNEQTSVDTLTTPLCGNNVLPLLYLPKAWHSNLHVGTSQ